MLFCPNCNSVLNISKNPPKISQTNIALNISTPDTISDTDISNETDSIDSKIEQMIKNILNNKFVQDSIYIEIKMDQLLKNSHYQKLDKTQKSIIQSKFATFFDKLDDSVNAYYFCKNCLYYTTIPPKSLIISRSSTSNITSNYINYSKLENRAKCKHLPYTRNYICVNDKCPTNTENVQKLATFYRLGTQNMQVWYTCTICGSYWKGE